jgi:transcriptional regulator with XRE-family HTH domain
MSPPIVRASRPESEQRFNEWVGETLKARRESLKLSRAFVGNAIAIDETTLLRNEEGTVPLTCARAAMLCRLYNMDMRELFS